MWRACFVGVKLCPTGWSTHKNDCYLVSSSRDAWAVAESACSSNGAHLISFHSAADQTIVETLAIGNGGVWIGLNDAELEGKYSWSDGSALDFVNWATVQRNDDPERHDCVVFEKGVWEVRECSERHHFVCKQPVALGTW